MEPEDLPLVRRKEKSDGDKQGSCALSIQWLQEKITMWKSPLPREKETGVRDLPQRPFPVHPDPANPQGATENYPNHVWYQLRNFLIRSRCTEISFPSFIFGLPFF